MNYSVLHNDALLSPFFNYQITAVQTRAYEIEYPAYNALRYLPQTSYAGPGDQFIEWFILQPAGMAKIISSYADDLPNVDVRGNANITRIQSLGDSYRYSLQEIRYAQKAGFDLDDRKAVAARRAMDAKINSLAWFGDQFYNVPGLLNNPNIPTYIAAATGTGGSTRWADKTPDQILADLNGLVQGIMNLTNDVERPNTILMSRSAYAYISTVARSTVSDTTILDFFRANNPEIQLIAPLWDLMGAGAGGTDVAIALDRDPRKLGLEIPQPFEQLPPQERNLEFVINCHMRYAGLLVYYPLSVAVLEGI